MHWQYRILVLCRIYHCKDIFFFLLSYKCILNTQFRRKLYILIKVYKHVLHTKIYIKLLHYFAMEHLWLLTACWRYFTVLKHYVIILNKNVFTVTWYHHVMTVEDFIVSGFRGLLLYCVILMKEVNMFNICSCLLKFIAF